MSPSAGLGPAVLNIVIPCNNGLVYMAGPLSLDTYDIYYKYYNNNTDTEQNLILNYMGDLTIYTGKTQKP
jgi:hypothetical protein